MKKPTVTIGIPAYNEEENIGYLLRRLLRQKENNFKLKEIIIVSDGSTDCTNEIINSISNSKIYLIKKMSRQGQQEAQNNILDRASGDIVVFIEADIIPATNTTISELIGPLIDKNCNCDMAVGCSRPVSPQNFFENVQYHGYKFKQNLFKEWKGGNNIYMAGGHSMKALSIKFARQLVWPANLPEDAYTYLRLKQLGMRMQVVKTANSYMKNTTNFKDRIKQCKKFQSGKHSLKEYFSPDIVCSEYKLPFKLLLKNIAETLSKNTFWTSLYIAEVIMNRILTLGSKEFNCLYEPYMTTKKLYILND